MAASQLKRTGLSKKLSPVPAEDHILGSGRVHAFIDIPQGPVSQEKKEHNETEQDQSKKKQNLPLPTCIKRLFPYADTRIP